MTVTSEYLHWISIAYRFDPFIISKRLVCYILNLPPSRNVASKYIRMLYMLWILNCPHDSGVLCKLLRLYLLYCWLNYDGYVPIELSFDSLAKFELHNLSNAKCSAFGSITCIISTVIIFIRSENRRTIFYIIHLLTIQIISKYSKLEQSISLCRMSGVFLFSLFYLKLSNLVVIISPKDLFSLYNVQWTIIV